jgi:hypothetical protein
MISPIIVHNTQPKRVHLCYISLQLYLPLQEPLIEEKDAPTLDVQWQPA